MEQNRMAKTSDAQLRAIEKWRKANTTSVMFRINNTIDSDVLEHLSTIDNKRAYFLSLIRADISKKQNKKWWIALNTEWNGDEFGRTIPLLATTEAEAIEEAKALKIVFNDFVKAQDPNATWVLFQGIKDEYSMSGWSDLSDPIDID